MANPRDTVAFTEIGYNATTFMREGTLTGAIDYLLTVSNPYGSVSTAIGKCASIVTSKTARVGQAGDRLLGKIVGVTSDCVVVQHQGYAEFSYVSGGTQPVIGQGVVCDAAGGVKVWTATSEYAGAHTVCVALDTTNLIATVLIR
jgi:hypothetical protein